MPARPKQHGYMGVNNDTNQCLFGYLVTLIIIVFAENTYFIRLKTNASCKSYINMKMLGKNGEALFTFTNTDLRGERSVYNCTFLVQGMDVGEIYEVIY